MTTRDQSQAPNVVIPEDVSSTSSRSLATIENCTFVLSRANTAHARTWNREEVTFQQFLDLFSNHRLDRKKDGPAFVAGELNGVERKAQAMNAAYFMVFDIDAAQSYDEVRNILNRENIHAIMYSTYSHLKTKTYVKTDKFVQWCVKNGIDPAGAGPGILHTQERMEKYVDDTEMREKLGGEFKVEERLAQTEEGMQICLTHKPIEKFRVLIPLGPAFVFAFHGYTSGEQAQAWKRAYIGVGRKLGLKFDMACADPSHISYLPSHPELDDGREAPHRLDHLIDPVVDGGPARVMLDFNTYPKADLTNLGKRNASAGPTYENVTATAGRTRATSASGPSANGLITKAWLKKRRGVYKLATLLHERGYTTGDRSQGGYTCKCPNAESHSDGKEDGAFVVDADPENEKPFVFSCSHNGCQHKTESGKVDVLPFLEKMLAEGWITREDLENPEYGGGPLSESVTPDQLKAVIATDPAFAIAVLMHVFANQTESERDGGSAEKKNGKGFNSHDAEKLTEVANAWNAGTLTRSGINLAMHAAPKYAKQVLAAVSFASLQDEAEAIREKVEALMEDAPDLSDGFYRNKDEDICITIKKMEVRVCQNFDVLASTLDHNEHHGVGIAFKDRQGRPREAFFKYSQIIGKSDEWLTRLVDEGFVVHDIGFFRKLLNEIKPPKMIKRTHKPGWTAADEFVLPGMGDVKLVGDNEVLGQRGTLEDWHDIARLAEGNSRLTFGLSQMFVGPLLKPLNGESGGFHLYSTTSDGKSASLRLSASVWGPSYITLNTSLASLETTLEHANDIGVCLDELGQLEKGAGGVAYMFGNERGKGRSKTDGEKRKNKEFRVAVMTCGEMSFAEKVEDEGKKSTGGHGSRIVTLNANAGKGYGVYEKMHGFDRTGDRTNDGAALSEHIKARVAENHGTAGPAFIAWLTERNENGERRLEDVKALAPALTDVANALTPPGSAPQVRRIAMRFAFVALAGELAIEAGVLPLPQWEPTRVVIQMWNEWIGTRGTNTDEVYQGTKRVLEFMRTRPQAFGSDNSVPIERYGFTVTEKDGRTVWYWLPEQFRKVVGNTASVAVAEALLAAGCLVPGEMRGTKCRLDRKKAFQGMPDGQRYYAVMLPVEREPGEHPGTVTRARLMGMFRQLLSRQYEKVGDMTDDALADYMRQNREELRRSNHEWCPGGLRDGDKTEEGVVTDLVW